MTSREMQDKVGYNRHLWFGPSLNPVHSRSLVHRTECSMKILAYHPRDTSEYPLSCFLSGQAFEDPKCMRLCNALPICIFFHFLDKLFHFQHFVASLETELVLSMVMTQLSSQISHTLGCDHLDSRPCSIKNWLPLFVEWCIFPLVMLLRLGSKNNHWISLHLPLEARLHP